MDRAAFEQSPAGRLVRVGQGNLAYWAFVPHPLPPPLPLDAELVRTLSDADRALGELAGLGCTLPNAQLLIRPFIRREAVLSSRIEGTRAGVADLYAYEAGQPVPFPEAGGTAPESDVREVLNYVTALEYGLDRLSTLPVSRRLIREMHQRLLHRVRGEHATPGEFRTTQNWIGPPGSTLADARYVPPPVPDMQEALTALERYLHEEDGNPPLIRLALIHYQFEAVHPFVDGNGRIGRLLLSLLLVSWNLLPLPLLYLSAFFEQHRDAYYDLLLAVSQRGAWREWLLYFLRGVREQARDAGERAKRLQDLQQDWRRRLRQGRRSALLLNIADSLLEHPILSAAQIQERFRVSHPTAMQALRQLESLGIVVEVSGRERNRVYAARPILDIVQ